MKWGPPGWYVLDIESPGMKTYHEEAIRIGAAATIERIVEMTIAGMAESVTVEDAGSGIDAAHPAASELRTIQPGRADGRVQRLSPGRHPAAAHTHFRKQTD